MLDDSNSTYIRCAATSAGEIVYSDEVCVTVNPEQESCPQITSFAQTRYVEADNSSAIDVPAMYVTARKRNYRLCYNNHKIS